MRTHSSQMRVNTFSVLCAVRDDDLLKLSIFQMMRIFSEAFRMCQCIRTDFPKPGRSWCICMPKYANRLIMRLLFLGLSVGFKGTICNCACYHQLDKNDAHTDACPKPPKYCFILHPQDPYVLCTPIITKTAADVRTTLHKMRHAAKMLDRVRDISSDATRTI